MGWVGIWLACVTLFVALCMSGCGRSNDTKAAAVVRVQWNRSR
jgi:hypothetical protein